jgi:hypothetical protein
VRRVERAERKQKACVLLVQHQTYKKRSGRGTTSNSTRTMFGIGRYLYRLCGRVVSTVRGVFGSDSSTLPKTRDCPTSDTNATTAQRLHEERRKQANADRFYSNGILVETVPDHPNADTASSRFEDTEAQLIFTTPAHQSQATAAAHDKPHPYQDENRMSVVMEPIE